MKNKNKSEHRSNALKGELKSYLKRGIVLSLHGELSKPYDIVKAYRVSEAGATYMRDYISDRNGNVKAIDFQCVKSND